VSVAVPRAPALRAVTLAGALTAWSLALPFAAAAVHAHGALRWAAFPVYGVGRLVCHQRPERSLHWGGTPWPVCARCAGLYLGLAAGAGAALGGRRRAWPPAQARWLVGLAALPTVATLVFEWTTGEMPAHAWRGASGIAIGAALGHVVAALLGGPDGLDGRARLPGPNGP